MLKLDRLGNSWNLPYIQARPSWEVSRKDHVLKADRLGKFSELKSIEARPRGIFLGIKKY